MTNQDKVKELIELRAQAKLGGGEKRIESQHKKGKYVADSSSVNVKSWWNVGTDKLLNFFNFHFSTLN